MANLDMGCSPTRQFLIEEYVDGTPIETDGLVLDSNINTFGITEQVVSTPPLFYIEGYLFPAVRTNNESDSILKTSNNAIKASKLENSGFSIEIKEKDEKHWVIEVNGRLGEDDGFPDLFRTGTGNYPILQWIEGITGKKIIDSIPSKPCALAYQNCYKEGIIKNVPGISPQGADSTTNVIVKPGTQMFSPIHPGISPHLAYTLATGETSLTAYKKAREIVNTLSFDIS